MVSEGTQVKNSWDQIKILVGFKLKPGRLSKLVFADYPGVV